MAVSDVFYVAVASDVLCCEVDILLFNFVSLCIFISFSETVPHFVVIEKQQVLNAKDGA